MRHPLFAPLLFLLLTTPGCISYLAASAPGLDLRSRTTHEVTGVRELVQAPRSSETYVVVTARGLSDRILLGVSHQLESFHISGYPEFPDGESRAALRPMPHTELNYESGVLTVHWPDGTHLSATVPDVVIQHPAPPLKKFLLTALVVTFTLPFDIVTLPVQLVIVPILVANVPPI